MRSNSNPLEYRRHHHRYDKILTAVRSCKMSRIKSLCRGKHGVSLLTAAGPYGGNSGVMMASQVGNHSTILYAIEKGCNVNRVIDDAGNTPLMMASAFGHQRVVHALLANHHHCDVDNLNNSLLLASKAGNTKIVNSLLVAGADIQSRDPFGNTPLILACKHGRVESAKAILSYRQQKLTRAGEVNIQFMRSCSLESDLSMICSSVVPLAKGITNINRQMGKSRRVSQWRGNGNTDINAINLAGETALIVVCRDADLELVRLLVLSGAQANIRDERNRTALDYLLEATSMNNIHQRRESGKEDQRCYQRTINLLVQAGADIRLAIGGI